MKNSQKYRSYNKSQRTYSSDSDEKSAVYKSFTQGDSSRKTFEDILMDISLKKPRNAYNIFITEMAQKENLKRKISEITKEYSSKFYDISEKDRKRYESIVAKDRDRYEFNLGLVKKFILEKPQKRNITGYRIYLDEATTEAIENNDDLEEAREKAKSNWITLTKDERQEYEDKRQKVADLYEELENSNKPVSGYTLFVKDQFQKARDKNKQINFIDIGNIWNNSKDSVKAKYDRYAEKIKEERNRKRNIYEIAFGLKPRKPIGGFKLFMVDMAKQGKFQGLPVFSEAHKMWRNLSSTEKEKYQRMHKKESLAYTLKKMEYNSMLRKNYYKAKSPFNFFVESLKGKNDNKSDEKFFHYASSQWKKASNETKHKFQKLADKDKEKADRLRKDFKFKSFDEPKKPISAFNRYIKERVPELSQGKKESAARFLSAAAKEWNDLDKEDKKKYTKEYEKALDYYYEQLEHFNKYGYYEKEDMKSQRSKTTSNSKTKDRSEDTRNEEYDSDRKAKKDKSKSKNSNSSSKKSKNYYGDTDEETNGGRSISKSKREEKILRSGKYKY